MAPQSPTPDADIGRQKLRLRNDLRSWRRENSGTPFFLIEDPSSGKFYRLGVREWEFAVKLNGEQTLSQVWQSQRDRQRLSEKEVAVLVHWLFANRLLECPDQELDRATQHQDLSRSEKWNPFYIRMPLCCPDRWLARWKTPAAWLFSRTAAAIWVSLCGLAMYRVSGQWERLYDSAHGILAPDNWMYLVMVWLVLKSVHELCHALACKHFGGSVPEAGIALMMFSPVAFVDVTSSWRFRSKWERIITSAAGMYGEFGIAAIAALVWSFTDNDVLAQVCYNAVIMASVATLIFNANPLMRFDGYYILSDLLEIQNLYTLSTQYVHHLGRRYILGMPSHVPIGHDRRAWFIKGYGIVAFCWRTMVMAGMVAAVSSFFHGLGIVLALFAAITWYAIPAVRLLRSVSSSSRPGRGVAGVITVGLTMVLIGMAPWPAGVRAPAVVDYAPMPVIRAETAGFVRQIHVRTGEQVEPDTLLVELHNPELVAQLKDAELAIERTDLRARIHHRNGELEKSQMEFESREALVQQREQLQRDIDRLKIRAPMAGRVIGRNLESLSGRYLRVGEAILALGLEERKEIQLSIAQRDHASFAAYIDRPVFVRIQGVGSLADGRLARIQPRASNQLPHEALGAAAGGPLAVRFRSGPGADIDPYELQQPRFVASIDLPAQQAARMHAGQMGTACVNTHESVGQHVSRAVSRWLWNRLYPNLVVAE